MLFGTCQKYSIIFFDSLNIKSKYQIPKQVDKTLSKKGRQSNNAVPFTHIHIAIHHNVKQTEKGRPREQTSGH